MNAELCRRAARHEAAHAVAAERLGGGWLDLWTGFYGDGDWMPWGGPVGVRQMTLYVHLFSCRGGYFALSAA